jgi:hypothetical protein
MKSIFCFKFLTVQSNINIKLSLHNVIELVIIKLIMFIETLKIFFKTRYLELI